MRKRLVGPCLIVSLLYPALARAYDHEYRLSFSSVNEVQSVGEASGEGSSLLFGLSVRGGFGLSHIVEVGGSIGFGMGTLLQLDGATDGTSTGVLEVSPMLFSAAADIRLSAGVAQSLLFERTHPLLGLRLGVAGRYLTDQRFKVTTPDGRVVMKPFAASDFSILPFAGLDLGVEHRFGRAFVVGLILGVTYGGSDYSAGQASLEASWHWY